MAPSMLKNVAIVFSLTTLLSSAFAQDPAIATTGLKPYTYQGCFSSSKPLTDQGSWTYQSPGYCQGLCVKLKKAVMGTTTGSNCFCGDQLPVANNKVSESKCNTACFGYDKDNCGGTNFWSVYLTGTNNAVTNIQGSSDSSPADSDSSSSTSPKAAATSTPKPKASVPPNPNKTNPAPATIVTKGTTIVVTAPGQTQAEATAAAETDKQSKGPNVAGIAAGVVVGVAVIASIAGGLFFFLRHRRRRAQQEHHTPNNENPFNTNNLPSSAASMSDSRLEPSVMMQRRQSDGSIADNQDYSRRILTVTNPDRR